MTAEKAVKEVLVRVQERIAIPHTVLLAPEPRKPKVPHTFNPDCLVHPVIAETILQAQPDVYKKAEGEPDLSKYQKREETVRENVMSLVQGLPEKERLQMYRYIQDAAGALKEGRQPGSVAMKTVEANVHPVLAESSKLFSDLTVAKLEGMTLEQLGDVYELLPGKYQPELPEKPKKAEVVEALAKVLGLT